MVFPSNAAISSAVLGLPDDTLDWWLTGATPDASDVSALTFDQAQLLYRRNNLIRFVHGFDALNVQVGETIWDPRAWVMGDVLHSRPVVFNYTEYTAAEENVCGPDGVHNSSVIFVGANDGMLHAFRDCDGRELWGFVPDDILANLKYLPGNKHTTFVDSPPAILFYDKEEDGEVTPSDGDKVIIIFGLRRGGGKNIVGTEGRGAYYALDITDINDPQFLWKLDLADYPQLAETWGIPVIKPVKVQGADADAPSEDIRYVAFIGAGYDQNEDLRFGDTQAYLDGTSLLTNLNQAPEGGSVDGLDTQDPPQTLIETSPGSDVNGFNMRGRGVAAILVGYMTPTGTGEDRRYNIQYTPAQNAAIGTLIWNYAPDSLSHSVATDIRTLDMNGNGGYIDTVYAGDLGGNLWRFDTTNRDPGSCSGASLDSCNWTGQIIFSSNSTYSNANTGFINGTADGNAGRKFFYPPAVAKDNNTTWVCFNTGDREHPLNLAVVDRLYCIKDFGDAYGHNTAAAIDESDLVDVTENLLQASTTTSTAVTEILNQLRSSPTRLLGDGTYKYGWYIRLDGKDRTLAGELGEKALAEPVIFNGEVFFSTYQLKTGERANCEAGNLGISRLYRLVLETGEAAYNYDLNNDTLTDADLSSPEDPQTGNDRASGGDNIAKRRDDRVKELGEGIPSGIVQVVDAAGNVSLLISSSDKVEGIGGANPTSTFPVYWIQR
jgi:type IV pilus assembly protein PilY1